MKEAGYMNIDTCDCGNLATVLFKDNEGWMTPMCETCCEKAKSQQKEANNETEQTTE